MGNWTNSVNSIINRWAKQLDSGAVGKELAVKTLCWTALQSLDKPIRITIIEWLIHKHREDVTEKYQSSMSKIDEFLEQAEGQIESSHIN